MFRISTEALKSWIIEDVDMKHLNAERITGRVGKLTHYNADFRTTMM